MPRLVRTGVRDRSAQSLAALGVIVLLSLGGYFTTRAIARHDQHAAAARRAGSDAVRAEILLERAKGYVVGLGELLAGEPTASQSRFSFLAGTTITSFDLVDAIWIERTRQGLVARYGTTVAPGTDVARWSSLAGPIDAQGTVFAANATHLGELHGNAGFWLLESGRFGRSAGYLAVFVPRGWMTLSLGDNPREASVELDRRRLDGLAAAPAASSAFQALGQNWRIIVNAPPLGSVNALLPWLALAWPWAAGLVVFMVASASVRRRRAEHEVERIFNLSPELLGIATHDGTFTRVNPAFSRTLGYTAEELTSRRLLEFAHPDDRERSREALERLARGEKLGSFENRYVRKDGSVCWLEWSVHPGPQDGRLYAAARDVTARREAEEEVRRAQEVLEESRAELAASRARVVAAADAERRRIERNLHDGAQQRLVALGLALRVAETEVPEDAPRLRAQIAGIVEELAVAVADLQELARGIHPAILSRGGLAPALAALSDRSGLSVDLETDVPGRLDERLEVATYYVVSEALNNAAKHASATRVQVRAQMSESTLEVVVSDDGIGGADASRGTGLVGLLDRVHALGGSLEISSPRGLGTTLRARLPLTEGPSASEEAEAHDPTALTA